MHGPLGAEDLQASWSKRLAVANDGATTVSLGLAKGCAAPSAYTDRLATPPHGPCVRSSPAADLERNSSASRRAPVSYRKVGYTCPA